ncbi:MAG: hypothetical protein GF408_02530 [Candidatus Omnitrophica bacterium]|nr:hypothetical protein [Candidatus Omnitrophota bacterium]
MAKKKTTKKKDFRGEMDKLVKRMQPVMERTGVHLSKAMKAAEEDISKMYRVAQTHLEIQMKNVQKEKLFHEMGKYVAEKLMKGDLDVADLDKYKKRLQKINTEGDKIKKKLNKMSSGAGAGKKPSSRKKKRS